MVMIRGLKMVGKEPNLFKTATGNKSELNGGLAGVDVACKLLAKYQECPTDCGLEDGSNCPGEDDDCTDVHGGKMWKCWKRYVMSQAS